MGWRVVAIENPAKLSLERGSLVIEQDQRAKIPIEDIDTLIVDTYATITTNLLSALATGGITTILCDDKHTPCSITMPLSQHSRQAKISQLQINMSQPLRKNLWQAIVKQKIINQASILTKFNYMEQAGQLIKLATDVRSGDTTNRESIAARIYFSALLDDSTRRKPTWYNSALNYSYAIIRSIVARSIATRGLIPSLGLFHHSELNSFNLADDIIEPYRAFVDNYVLSTMATKHIGEDNDDFLTTSDRHTAIDILNNSVIINHKQYVVRDAVDMTVESLVRAIINKSVDELLLPQLIA